MIWLSRFKRLLLIEHSQMLKSSVQLQSPDVQGWSALSLTAISSWKDLKISFIAQKRPQQLQLAGDLCCVTQKPQSWSFLLNQETECLGDHKSSVPLQCKQCGYTSAEDGLRLRQHNISSISYWGL